MKIHSPLATESTVTRPYQTSQGGPGWQVLRLEHQNDLVDMLEHRLSGPPKSFWIVGLGWGLGICILTSSQVILLLLVLGPHSEDPWSRKWGLGKGADPRLENHHHDGSIYQEPPMSHPRTRSLP